MSNKRTKITLFIILCCIALLIIGIFVNLFARSGKFTFRMGDASVILTEKSCEAKQVKKVIVKNDSAGDLKIEKSKDNRIYVTVCGDKDDTAEVKLKGKTLNISKKAPKKVFVGFSGSGNEDITILVPARFCEDWVIENQSGDVVAGDTAFDRLQLECSAGDIELGKVKILEASVESGDMDIKSLTEKCRIDMQCGDLSIKKVTLKKDSEIKVESGDCHINKTKGIYAEGEADTGDVSIKNVDRKAPCSLRIKADTGDINVN